MLSDRFMVPKSLVNPTIDEICQQIPSRNSRIVIAISGAPGSGKSTLAQLVARHINAQSPNSAIAIGMDGFHYYRRELDVFEDPKAAHKFRGAPFTFNVEKVTDLAKKLHTSTDLYCPVFEHRTADPQEPGTRIPGDVKVVIFEGNYLLLDEDKWRDLSQYWDAKWLLEVPVPVLRDRLAKRHLEAGLVKSLDEGYDRADFNDIPNGILVQEHSVEPDLIIHNFRL